MYACPDCGSTDKFLAHKDGMLIRVLEDHEDVAGLKGVKELLCAECNHWFPNPTKGKGAHSRVLQGELVMITGLKGKGTIKTVATGLKLPFHYDTYEEEIAALLNKQSHEFVSDLQEFTEHGDAQLAIRAKERGNDNTWVYRISRRKLWKNLKELNE